MPFVGRPKHEEGSIRASTSLRILRFLRCLLFKNPIQLPYHNPAGRNEALNFQEFEDVSLLAAGSIAHPRCVIARDGGLDEPDEWLPEDVIPGEFRR